MKKQLTLLAIALIIATTGTKAQTAFSTMDSVNINKINALVLVHGDMWWNPSTSAAHCYFPAGSGKNINFTSALWMGGYDGSSQLHVAAQTYRQDGNDYWPGPLDASDTLTYATSAKWAKIWKVNRTDINDFLGITTHTTTNTPAPILTWPAKGNTNAAGAGGSSLTITTDMAPFVDVNGNGIYEPLAGDYPDVKGDQALWWVFSDNGPSHSNSNGKPIGVEIQAMAYAYSRGTLIDNVIYYDYKIVNKSTRTYNNFRMGLWDDIDLGYYQDDFIGFDSSHRMGITYNGNNDDGGSAGHPANSFGTQIPIVGVSLIILPGDDLTAHTHVPAGSYMYYTNDATIWGNPNTDTQYYYYLTSRSRTGVQITNDFAGVGVPSTGHGAGPACNYVFPGDPSVNTEWSECVSGNTPGDRRFIVTSNDFTLSAGSSQRVVMALVTTNPDTVNGCPSHGFGTIKNLADTAWNIFYNPLPPILAVPNDGVTDNNIIIYPNPAHNQVFIEDHSKSNEPAKVVIYNSIGQVMNALFVKSTNSIDIASFPAGVYHILYQKGSMQKAATVMKE